MAGKTLFMTGATGSIGRELIRTFLDQTDHRLFLLVRSKNRDSHQDRVEKLLAKMGINGRAKDRIEVFSGDVTKPRFGLEPKGWDRIVGETEEFHHIAALTNLGAEWKEAEEINVTGTEHALELARAARERGKLQRFFYFSTAYVAGSLTPVHAREDELAAKPLFANAYEATKFLAEKRVREEASAGLPVTILRPSIVVGNSESGAVSEFNVIYPFWRLFAHGILKKVPSRLKNAFNIVPIDFVVRSTFEIARQESSLGKTFHLVSEHPPTLEMLLQVKEEYDHFPPVEVVDPERFSVDELGPMEREIFSKITPYLGYLGSSLTFDVTNTRRALEGSGVEFPRTDRAFLKKIIDYAIRMGYFLSPSN